MRAMSASACARLSRGSRVAVPRMFFFIMRSPSLRTLCKCKRSSWRRRNTARPCGRTSRTVDSATDCAPRTKSTYRPPGLKFSSGSRSAVEVALGLDLEVVAALVNTSLHVRVEREQSREEPSPLIVRGGLERQIPHVVLRGAGEANLVGALMGARAELGRLTDDERASRRLAGTDLGRRQLVGMDLHRVSLLSESPQR